MSHVFGWIMTGVVAGLLAMTIGVAAVRAASAAECTATGGVYVRAWNAGWQCLQPNRG